MLIDVQNCLAVYFKAAVAASIPVVVAPPVVSPTSAGSVLKDPTLNLLSNTLLFICSLAGRAAR